ncbi:MAG: DUF3291 domain-containing protein [Hyphomonadaceae bacterium]
MARHHLAELNIAEALYPMDDARMEGFTSRINMINAMADRADGFVWRLVDDNPETDGALDFRPFPNPNMLVNMSVWRDVQSLYSFVYKTVHAKLIGDRKDWFSLLKAHSTVMWWIEGGVTPTIEEAKARLERLTEHGPSPDAFTFANTFTADRKPLIWRAPKKDCA